MKRKSKNLRKRRRIYRLKAEGEARLAEVTRLKFEEHERARLNLEEGVPPCP